VIAASAAVAIAAGGCGKSTAREGTERGPCYGNGTCNEGLDCLSEVCVKLPSIVDDVDEIVAAACACTDAACTDKAQKELALLFTGAEEATPSQRAQLEKSVARMTECVARFPNPLVTQIDALADEACACGDMKCAEGVQGRLMELVKDATEPSKADADAIMKSMERMGDCMAKLAVPR